MLLIPVSVRLQSHSVQDDFTFSVAVYATCNC